MPIAETARLTASLDLDDSRYQAGFKKADATLTGFERKTIGTFARIKQGFGVGVGFAAFNASVAVAAKGVSLLGGAIEGGVRELNEIQAAQAGTDAVIKSTGSAANVTAQQVSALASSLEDMTAIEDDVIQTGANVVLRFTNVRNAVGANNDIFNRTVKAAADMAVALNKGVTVGADLTGSATKLGKALNDPVKGIAQLARVGITFSASEQKAIKDAVKHNDVLAAQKIILDRVTRSYGGAAVAATQTYAGQQARLSLAVKNLQQSLVTGLLPGLTAASKALADTFRSPEFIQGAKDLGTAIGNALSPENIKAFIGLARTAAGTVGNLIGALKSGWEAIPPELRDLLIKGAVVDRTFKFLFGFSPAKLVVSVATDAIAKGLGGLLGGLFQRGGSPATPIFTKEVGVPIGGIGGSSAAGGGSLLDKFTKAFSLLTIIGSGIAVAETAREVSNQIGQDALSVQTQTLEWIKKQPTRDELINGLTAVNKGIADTLNNGLPMFLKGDALKALEDTRNLILTQIREQDAARSMGGFSGFEGKGPGFRPADVVKGTSEQFKKVAVALDQLHQDFLNELQVLRTSKDPKALAEAAAQAAADIVKGVGSVETTKSVINLLKQQIAAAKDPELRKALTDALRRVESKLPGREWIAAQERAAERIVASSRPVVQKISELARIQAALAAKGDTKAAAIIAAKIESLKSHLDSIAASVRALTGILGRSRQPGPLGPQNRPIVTPEAPDPSRNRRTGFTASDLKTAVTEGNRNVAARGDISELRTDLGQRVRDARNGIVTTTAAGLRGVQGGVRDLSQTLRAAQHAQAAALSQAIGRLAAPLDRIPAIGPTIKGAILSLIPHIDNIAARIAISVFRLTGGTGTARVSPSGSQNRPSSGYVDSGGGRGGGRATGGPVLAGLEYRVGERGPEIFVPGEAGTILPNWLVRGAANSAAIVRRALGPRIALDRGVRPSQWIAPDETVLASKMDPGAKSAKSPSPPGLNALIAHNARGPMPVPTLPSLGRAGGGPVWPGRWMVGEKGPEVLNLLRNGMGFVTPTRKRVADVKDRWPDERAVRESPQKPTIARLVDVARKVTRPFVARTDSRESNVNVTLDRSQINDLRDNERPIHRPSLPSWIRDYMHQVGSRLGGRASGGPVWPGRWLMGETGPEVLSLQRNGSGYVTPRRRGQDVFPGEQGTEQNRQNLLRLRPISQAMFRGMSFVDSIHKAIRSGRLKIDPSVRFNPNIRLDLSQIEDLRPGPLQKTFQDVLGRIEQGLLEGAQRKFRREDAVHSARTGRRQAGGPVGPGRWLVGEDGPEILNLYRNGTQGYVTPTSTSRQAIGPMMAMTREILSAIKATIGILRAQLAADPELKRSLQAALRSVSTKLPGREWIAAQEKTAREIAASQKPSERKISELTAIERALIARGDRVAAGVVDRLIAKERPPVVKQPTVVRVSTSWRDTSNATTIHNRYGPTRSQAGAS